MNTNVRKKAASNGRKAPAPLSIRESLRNAREKLSSKNGKLVLFILQFLLSFVTLFYFKGVLKLAYYSMFYRLEIPEETKGKYCLLVSLVCLFFGAVMLFTRRQIVTRVIIMISMPFYLPIILFNYQHLVLLIPLAIMVVTTYLFSGTGEAPKTILGAVFLMLYILGAFVYLTAQSILQPATQEVVIARDVSPGGCYRYSVVQVLDQADGNTYVAIEPNTKDIAYGHSKWYAKGYSKTVYLERPLDTFNYEWTTQTRAEITRELITNNPSTTFILSAGQMRLLGLDEGYSQEYTIGELSRSQRHKLGYGDETDPIDTRLRRFFRVKLMPTDYTVTLTFDEMVDIGLNPTYEQRLSRMTDEDLALLGVPEENEVLIVNGKIAFRQYVAELERFYWDSSRSLTAFLESNTLPEVQPDGLDLDQIRKEREEALAAKAATGTSSLPAVTDTTTETTATAVGTE
ncbi:MAG: hypothetical protein IJ060_07625 [Oscillospiraceae bacterium]|nr:hypothetical protein [Oscillospiraceae bacterium]